MAAEQCVQNRSHANLKTNLLRRLKGNKMRTFLTTALNLIPRAVRNGHKLSGGWCSKDGPSRWMKGVTSWKVNMSHVWISWFTTSPVREESIWCSSSTLTLLIIHINLYLLLLFFEIRVFFLQVRSPLGQFPGYYPPGVWSCFTRWLILHH